VKYKKLSASDAKENETGAKDDDGAKDTKTAKEESGPKEWWTAWNRGRLYPKDYLSGASSCSDDYVVKPSA